MAAAKSSTPKPKPNELILYRLELVEQAVKDVNVTLAGKENITKADLIEFRTAILERFDDRVASLQKEIDDKADKSEVADLKGLVKAVGAVFGSIIVGIVVYYFTQGSK